MVLDGFQRRLKEASQASILTEVEGVREESDGAFVTVKATSVGPQRAGSFPERDLLETRAIIAALVETGMADTVQQALTPPPDLPYQDYVSIANFTVVEEEMATIQIARIVVFIEYA
jgi:hypothetical protein